MKPLPRVTSTRLFRNGNSQAVRIPKALAFDSVDIEVVIERRGEELIVRPAKRRLTGLGAEFRKLAPHFRGFVREQPDQARRAAGHRGGRGFVREQPDQDQRDWTPARSGADGRNRSRNS